MSKRVPNRARGATAAMLLASVLVTAGSIVPAYGQATETTTPPAAVDSPEDGAAQDPAPEDGSVEGDGAANGEQAVKEREYEPEPTPTPTPEREYEPEPEPSPTPSPSPEPSPSSPAEPAPKSEPAPEQTFEPQPQDEPPTNPVGAAGSTPQETFVPERPEPDPAPAAASEPEGAPGSGSSARAVGPGLSSSLRSSTDDESFEEGVQAPLVAPRDVARADDARGSRRSTGAGGFSDALTLADRKLLASAGPFGSDGSTLTVGSDTPAGPVLLASVLLLVMATLVGRTYTDQRRRPGTEDTPA